MKINFLFFTLLIFTFVNCSKDDTTPPVDPPNTTGSVSLITKLKEDIRLEDKHTCVGDNESPEIAWNDSYTITKGYAIIVSNNLSGADREIYWLLSDIPTTTNKIEIGEVIAGAVSGVNYTGGTRYSGPCPDAGNGIQEFKIQFFALDKTLGLSSSMTEDDLISAMTGSILEEKSFTGFYSPFNISSNNFGFGEAIPATHTCDGNHEVPNLKWTNGVENAAAYAIYMYDTRAGNFIHWIVTDIEGTEITQGSIPEEAVNGLNSRSEIGYFGPCPGEPSMHTYYFRLFALDEKLGLTQGFTLAEIETAMDGHVIDITDFYATYTQ